MEKRRVNGTTCGVSEHCPACQQNPLDCGCVDVTFASEQEKAWQEETRRGKRGSSQGRRTRRGVRGKESENGSDRTTGNLGNEIGARISGGDTEDNGGWSQGKMGTLARDVAGRESGPISRGRIMEMRVYH